MDSLLLKTFAQLLYKPRDWITLQQLQKTPQPLQAPQQLRAPQQLQAPQQLELNQQQQRVVFRTVQLGDWNQR
jgi:hypothetical protein